MTTPLSTDARFAAPSPPRSGARLRRRIVCFGNPLHGDDGAGRAVFERLAACDLPAEVSVSDAGPAGAAAIALFEGVDEVVVVDASAPAGRPGRVWWPDRADLAEAPSGAGHGLGVGHLLRCVDTLLDPAPRIVVVAIEAASVTAFRPGLSDPVARAADRVAALLRRRAEEGDDV